MTRHFENLLGIAARNDFFAMNGEQTKLALDEIVRREAGAPGGPRPYSLLQSFAVTQWRINGQTVATDSTFSMHYGPLPVLSTSLRFESIEQFESIQRVLKDLNICKLNEKHLKPVRIKQAKA